MAVLAPAAAFLGCARDLGLRVATAESCTGGLLAAALTDAPGSSDVFERGFITYSNAAKIEVLGVSPSTLEHFGAVSEDVAREMAAGALSRSAADIAISITGIAGPGASEHKPEGRVCFALARRGLPTSCQTIEFSAIGRAAVRAAAVKHALQMLIAAVT